MVFYVGSRKRKTRSPLNSNSRSFNAFKCYFMFSFYEGWVPSTAMTN